MRSAPDRLEAAAADRRGKRSASVGAAVAARPERQRLVVFLRHYADLDYRTIGRILSMRPDTVGATLNAAHATLRGSRPARGPRLCLAIAAPLAVLALIAVLLVEGPRSDRTG